MVSSLRLSLVFISTAQAAAFIASSLVPSRSAVVGTTKLGFGFNGLGSPKPSKDEEDAATDKPEKKIGAAGLLQLITAGMGAPFLGDYQGVDDVSDYIMSKYGSLLQSIDLPCMYHYYLFDSPFLTTTECYYCTGRENDVLTGGEQSCRRIWQ